MCGQGHKHMLARWFTTMDWLLRCIYDAEVDFKSLRFEHGGKDEYAYLEAAAHASWEKCEEYYKYADDSAAYYAAQVLLPNKKWAWFKEQFDQDENKQTWLTGDPEFPNDRGIKGLVEDLWKEEYKGKYGKSAATDPSPPVQYRPYETFGGLDAHEQLKGTTVNASDRYQVYATSDPESTDDPLKYWNSRYLSQPDLARFALDMLAIPLMSAECERIFSSAKHLITDSRNRLKADIIEANECLRSWFGPPHAKAFAKGEDSDDEQHEDTAAGKADAATATSHSRQIQDSEAEQQDKQPKGVQEWMCDSDDSDDSNEDNGGNESDAGSGDEVEYMLTDD